MVVNGGGCLQVAMMFVRCAGGHSHSPLEYVSPPDVAAATSAMYALLSEQLPGDVDHHVEL